MEYKNPLSPRSAFLFVGASVESFSESEEETQLTSAENPSLPGRCGGVAIGTKTMKLNGSKYAHGLIAQPVVVPQTDSKLSFVVLLGSVLLPAANLVQRATLALHLAVSSS